MGKRYTVFLAFDGGYRAPVLLCRHALHVCLLSCLIRVLVWILAIAKVPAGTHTTNGAVDLLWNTGQLRGIISLPHPLSRLGHLPLSDSLLFPLLTDP